MARVTELRGAPHLTTEAAIILFSFKCKEGLTLLKSSLSKVRIVTRGG